MARIKEEDNALSIHLFYYDKKDTEKERFCFSEMTTLQATTLLDSSKKITSCTYSVSVQRQKLLTEKEVGIFATIGKFNEFFINHSDYYLFDCELTLEEGIIIESHDDGEVQISLPINDKNTRYIENLFRKYKLPYSLLRFLRNNPERYIEINAEAKVIAVHSSFDDYINQDSE